MTIRNLSDIEALEAQPLSTHALPRTSYEALAETAARTPDAKALSFFLSADACAEAFVWTYAELLADVTRAANAFHGHCHGAPGLRRSRWPGSPTRMNKISYSGYRFPPEIIQQAIWLYLRFTLSLRDVEDLLAERGVAVSYETVRRWVNHFGPMIAADLRKRRPKPHTTWHLDEGVPRTHDQRWECGAA